MRSDFSLKNENTLVMEASVEINSRTFSRFGVLGLGGK